MDEPDGLAAAGGRVRMMLWSSRQTHPETPTAFYRIEAPIDARDELAVFAETPAGHHAVLEPAGASQPLNSMQPTVSPAVASSLMAFSRMAQPPAAGVPPAGPTNAAAQLAALFMQSNNQV